MTEIEKERQAREDLQVARATADRLEAEVRRLRESHDLAVASAQPLLDELAALKLAHEDLIRQSHGWPWALERLAEGLKVTHPILTGHPESPGWIEKLGTGPRGNIYEVHESYCFRRMMEHESAWQELANKARMSIGWSVIK